MKRGLALLLAALFTALALTACGGSGGGKEVASGTTASGGYYDAAENFSAEQNWGFYAADAEAPAAAPMEAEEGQTEAADRLASAKMIYTAYIEAETMDFDACAADLEAAVEQMGGYLEYASASSFSDGLRSGSYTARIPAARFKSFLKSVGELSHVTDQNQSADNISEKYYDTESRLTTQKTKLERLQTLLARAENMEDIISLESAIAETELQIEQLTGTLRHYDALVDYATVEIRLREVPRLTAVEQSPPSFASQLANAFTGGLHSFGDFLQGLAIFLAYNWIWLTLLALIAALIARAGKRRRARQGETFRQAKLRDTSFFRRTEKDEVKNPDDKQPKD